MDKKEKSSNRKMADDKLLPGFDSSSQDLKCDTCDKHFTDSKSYEDHLKSKKHQNTALQEKLKPKLLKVKEASSSDSDESSSDDDLHELVCELCDKRFNNYTSYMTHKNGKSHAKNVKKQKLKDRMSNMPELIDQENGEEGSDDEILQKPFAHCATCQKDFPGPESLELHMKGTNHKKKMKQSRLVDIIKSKYQDEVAKEVNEEEFFSKCKVCDKSFSGVIPYQIHMKSGTHKKELKKMEVAEEVKEFRCHEDPTEGYVCKECNKSFKDPLGFKAHLEKNSHEKQKAKNALKEFLNAYPEIVFATPMTDQTKESDEDDDLGYFLICKICHTSFCGPESAQDHVKSKKHISVKKKKEMLKVLKQENAQESNSKVVNGKSEETSVKESQEKKSQSPAKNGPDVKKQGDIAGKENVENEDFEMI